MIISKQHRADVLKLEISSLCVKLDTKFDACFFSLTIPPSLPPSLPPLPSIPSSHCTRSPSSKWTPPNSHNNAASSCNGPRVSYLSTYLSLIFVCVCLHFPLPRLNLKHLFIPSLFPYLPPSLPPSQDSEATPPLSRNSPAPATCNNSSNSTTTTTTTSTNNNHKEEEVIQEEVPGEEAGEEG